MMPEFTDKLDTLVDTVRLLDAWHPTEMASSLVEGQGCTVIAVGSGGSAVAAHFLARCRDTLGLGPTIVQTPMEMVLGIHDLFRCDVWLFSAGADNADITAAVRVAIQRQCRRMQMVTRDLSGAASELVRKTGGKVHAVPVATDRDGYLATHSLIAAVVALLIASEVAADEPRHQRNIVLTLAEHLGQSRDPKNRSVMSEAVSFMSSRDTILLIADPQLSPVANLIETSIWETSLCPIQWTDFRNFAHGRHAWLHHRADASVLMCLTGSETARIWGPLMTAIPATIRRVVIDFGDCGRLANAFGIIDGFGLIEALGRALGVDPAKPGFGSYGRTLYDDRGLDQLALDVPAAVRHKRAAMAKADSRAKTADPLLEIATARLEGLGAAAIGGLVLDYDGTLVATSERFSPPGPDIVAELVRLDAVGARIGIATGRGGSAGRNLRAVLPEAMHKRVIIGYYNGSYITTLDVDLELHPAPADEAISDTEAWLRSQASLFVAPTFKVRGTQITIDAEILHRPYCFRQDMLACPAFQAGLVRVTCSGHSFDIVSVRASKLRVVEEIRSMVQPGVEVLCFGDSGSSTGNDHALLSHPFGISVGAVCGTPNGCWTLFGYHPTGPDALVEALRAIVPSASGGLRLDVTTFLLDLRWQRST